MWYSKGVVRTAYPPATLLNAVPPLNTTSAGLGGCMAPPCEVKGVWGWLWGERTDIRR